MAKDTQRLALMIGSSQGLGDSIEPLPVEAVRRTVNSLAQVLREGGEHAFTVKRLFNPTRPELIRYLSDFRENHPSPKLPALIYYFGHARIVNDGDLMVALKGADPSEPNPYLLRSILDEARHARLRKAAIIVECCHAGLSKKAIQLDWDADDYFLMAATNTGYLRIREVGGPFSYSLTRVLQGSNLPAELEDRTKRAITFARWVDVARKYVPKNLVPQVAGNLGSEILRPWAKSTRAGYASQAPIKSVYSKAYRVLRYCEEESPTTAEIILRCIKRDKDRAFQLASRDADARSRRSVAYVTDLCIERYLELLEDLGFVRREALAWKITALGRQAVSRNGGAFNSVLVNAVWSHLDDFNVSDERIRDAIGQLLSQVAVPHVSSIEQHLAMNGCPAAPQANLKMMLKLLSYADEYQRATSDCYFP